MQVDEPQPRLNDELACRQFIPIHVRRRHLFGSHSLTRALCTWERPRRRAHCGATSSRGTISSAVYQSDSCPQQHCQSAGTRALHRSFGEWMRRVGDIRSGHQRGDRSRHHRPNGDGSDRTDPTGKVLTQQCEHREQVGAWREASYRVRLIKVAPQLQRRKTRGAMIGLVTLLASVGTGMHPIVVLLLAAGAGTIFFEDGE